MTPNRSTDGSGLGINRRTVLQATGMATVGAVAIPGTVSANCPDCTCVTLGKITENQIKSLEEGTTSEFTLTLDGDLRTASDPACQGDKDVTVLVTPTEFKDNEVTCVDLEIRDDNGACQCADDGLYLCGARVKGGRGFAAYSCGDVVNDNQDFSSITDSCAPVNDKNGKRYGISHIVVEVCVFPNDKLTGSDCAEGGGG